MEIIDVLQLVINTELCQYMQFRRKFTKHKNFAFQFLNVSWIEDHFNQLDSEDSAMYWAHDHEEHGKPDDVP